MSSEHIEKKKEKLHKSAEEYKRAVEDQLNQSYGSLQTVAKYSLAGGAVMLGAYFLAKSIGKDEKDQDEKISQDSGNLLAEKNNVVEKPPRGENQLGNFLKKQAALLLISISAKLIKDHILKPEDKNEQTNTSDANREKRDRG